MMNCGPIRAFDSWFTSRSTLSHNNSTAPRLQLANDRRLFKGEFSCVVFFLFLCLVFYFWMQPSCEGDCVHSSVLPYVRHRVEWGYIESPARSTFISDRGRNQPKLDLNRDSFLC